MAFRVLRNCSQEEQREIRFKELKIKLLERGYRSRSIEDFISRVKNLRREDVFQRVVRASEENQNRRVRAIFKFDQRVPNLSKIMHKNWQTMLSDDSRLKSVFPEPPMVCYKRGRNLREILCQARLPPGRLGRHEDGFRMCMQPNCRLCPYTGLRPGEVVRSIKISHTGEEVQIKGELTCQSSNMLYMLWCGKEDRTCPTRDQYCGETKKSGEDRFIGHKNNIINNSERGAALPVGEHFRREGHSVSDLVFCPFEQIYGGDFVRKSREKMYINKYQLIDNGLNRKL